MAVSRLQTSRRILGLISNAKPKAPGKVLSLEVGINLQPTTVHQKFYSTGAHIYHEPSVASGLKLHSLSIEIAFKELEESRQVDVYTDASSLHGLGCVWGNKWVCGSWSSECRKKYSSRMEILESYAMLVSMEAWADQYSGRHVTVHCDHQGVVDGFNKKCKKKNTPLLQKWFDRMDALADIHGFRLEVVKADIQSDLHRGADGLSRGSSDKFLRYIPQAEAAASKIPGHLDLVGYAYISQQCFKSSGK